MPSSRVQRPQSGPGSAKEPILVKSSSDDEDGNEDILPLPPIPRGQSPRPRVYRAYVYVRPKVDRHGRLAPPEDRERKPRRGHSGSKSAPVPAPTPASTSTSMPTPECACAGI
ncbi:hypothetical protein FRC07_003659 [Ceratobasidium sp. 392]|nr:hypothetical protein FRC07_003659 [Ceratobasidium sp. 392]